MTLSFQQAVKTSWPDFAPLRIFSKMFWNIKIAQNLPGGLFDLLYNLRKNIWGSEKNTPYFQAPM